MDTIRICGGCRQPLPEGAPEGLCPGCLAKLALSGETAAASGPPPDPPTAAGAPGRVPPTVAELAPQFPQLEILEFIGMGGMGMVYKARQPRLDRLVALKILPVTAPHQPSFAERFGREARALARLNHPGIVAIYDFGQTDQCFYLVMEFVDGLNLRQLLKSGGLDSRQALDIVVQVCGALQFAHDEGVVHRDIKPENILVNKKGQVKIADFGLAKLLGATPDTGLTVAQAAMGTVNYMAPEQRENAGTVDHRADIYSLGVVFYEMLTGEIPMGRFDPPSKRVLVDARLDEVVLRALEREPERRYQQAGEVKTKVESLATAPAAPASPPAEANAGGQEHIIATELIMMLGLTALIGFAIEKLQTAWPLALLLFGGWTVDKKASHDARRWLRALWIVCVIGLTALGVWVGDSAWPIFALLFLFDWKISKDDEKKEEEEDDEDTVEKPDSSAPKNKSLEALADGAPSAMPFSIMRRVSGPFGKVCGLVRLEADTLAFEMEVKSILPGVRRAMRVVRVPYRDLASADSTSTWTIILRANRLAAFSEFPTLRPSELTLALPFSSQFPELDDPAARKFAAAIKLRMRAQSTPPA